MTGWWLWIGLAVGGGAPAAAEPPAADQAAIEQAVRGLGDARFSMRQRSSRELWEHGLAAEKALQEAAASDDRETRLRARALLNDFRYGILPHVPADTVALIRQFRDGKAAERLQALERLADRDEFETVQRLIQLEENQDIRRQLLVRLMQNPRALEKFLDVERLQQLIQSVAADRDDVWRRTVLAQLLFSEKMVQQLADKGRLAVLVKMLEQESSGEVRRQMLSTLLQNQSAVCSLIDKDQLALVLQLIGKEPDQNMRAFWLGQVLAWPEVVKRLIKDDRLDRVLQAVQAQVEGAKRAEVFQRLFQNPPVLEAIVAKRGMGAILALTAAERDPSARGRLRAMLIMSPALRQQMNETAVRDLALKLARDEQDASSRGEYLKALLESGAGYSLFRDREGRKLLWDFVKSEAAAGAGGKTSNWRGDAVFQLLSMWSVDEVFRDAEEIVWLMKFVKAQTSVAQRTRLLERLVSDYRMQQLLFKHGQFEAVLELLHELPPGTRGRLLGQLFRSPEPVQRLVAAKQLERMVTLAKEESDAEARAAYLEGLFSNQAALQALIQGGFYDRLWELVANERDPVRQATLRAEFLRTSPALQAFTSKHPPETLVKYAQELANPDARRQYLQRLFSIEPALSPLIEGHYDALLALAKDQEEASARSALLAAFYANPKVVERLVQKQQLPALLEFADTCTDLNQLVNFLQRLVNNEKAITALVEQGRLEALLEIVRKPQDKYQRASLMGTVLGAPPVAKHFAEGERWKKLLAMLDDESPDTRWQLYYPLFGRPDTVAVLIEKGRLNDMIALMKKETRPEMRGQWLAMLLVQPKTIERLTAEKRLKLILEAAREQHEENARRPFLQTLFGNPQAVGALLDAGEFDALYDLACAEAEPQQKAQLLGQLLGNPKTVAHLVAKKKVGLLLQLTEQQGDEEIRREFLTHLLGSPPAVAALIEHQHFDALVRLCRSEPDPPGRRRLLAELLMSGKAIEQLAKAGSLTGILEEILGEPDKEARRQFLERWFGHPDAVSVLVAHGHFDTLYKAARTDFETAQCRQLVGQLLANQNTLQHLATHGKIELLLQVISDEDEPWRRSYILQNLLARADTVQALLAAGKFENLLKLIQNEPQPPVRSSLLASLLLAPATVQYLAKNQQLDRLKDLLQQPQDPNVARQFLQRLLSDDAGRQALGQARLGETLLAALKADPDEKTRQTLARQVVQDQRIRQVLVESGQTQVLYELAKWEPDEKLRQANLQRLLCAPTGLVPYHIQRGELPQALRLLEENATDDTGRLRLATYLAVTGQLEPRLAAVRKQLEAKPPADASRIADARLLTYLCRAQGDLSAARDAAALTQDSGLLLPVLVEQRQWAEAAKLQAAGPCPLPIPVGDTTKVTEPQLQLERLGLVAAYQRLAGQETECDQTLAEIQRLVAANPADQQLGWLGVEAFLLNDRVEPGLKLLAETSPARAFDLYSQRYQYRQALALAKYPDAAAPDRAWLQALPVTAGAGGQAWARADFALKVVHLLNLLGRRDEAVKLIDLLEAYAQEQPNDDNSNSQRRLQERLAVALVHLDLAPRAWELAARTLNSPDSTPSVLLGLYPRQYQEAAGWWMVFRNRHPDDESAETFARLHRVMAPPPDEKADEFRQLAEDATQLGTSLGDALRATVLLAVGESCVRRKQYDLALRCLEPIRDGQTNAGPLYAEALRRSEQWPAAAEACEAVWKRDHEQLGWLYLSGDALARAGRADDARQRKELASRLALDSRARLGLALLLKQHDLREDAEQQFQWVLRTAPPVAWEWNSAVHYLAEYLAERDPAVAAESYALSLLDDLRVCFYLLSDRDYLNKPALVNRLRAQTAVRAGQFEAADRWCQRARAALPGDTDLGELLVPALEQAGRQAQADELFTQLHRALAEAAQAYPKSALVLNNLAWLNARCGRLLDEALQHAEQAVALAPNNGGYLDTLAEVYFRRGDRETAVRHERRALELRPNDETLRKQLERFQTMP